jgi:hypothetical protein
VRAARVSASTLAERGAPRVRDKMTTPNKTAEDNETQTRALLRAGLRTSAYSCLWVSLELPLPAAPPCVSLSEAARRPVVAAAGRLCLRPRRRSSPPAPLSAVGPSRTPSALRRAPPSQPALPAPPPAPARPRSDGRRAPSRLADAAAAAPAAAWQRRARAGLQPSAYSLLGVCRRHGHERSLQIP